MTPEPLRTNRELEARLATPPLDERSLALRRLAFRGMVGGERGHLGSAFSTIEILRVLYDDIMVHRADEPNWALRDQAILSKGHGCLALYAVLADRGYFPADERDRFCHVDGMLGGHPDATKVPGVEASTGALGHGPSIGLGLALAARMKAAVWRVFVVTGDGEINEGAVWEAAMMAGKHGLDNLTVIVDYNKHQSYAGRAKVQNLEPLAAKWESFAFGEVDGHDVGELRRTLTSLPFASGRPSAVIAHTVKGKGVSFAENDMAWHHKSRLAPDQLDAVHAELGRWHGA